MKRWGIKMPEEISTPKSSLKNNIMIALLLFIMLGGIVSTGIFQQVLQSALQSEGLDKKVITDITRQFTVISTGLTIAAIFVALFIAMFLSRTITGPIKKLIDGASEVARGNLDAEIHIDTQDELGNLARDFNHMTASLKAKISELKETTAAKERIESELNIARQIQMGILPKIFPPFPHRREFDIHALIEPARMVGGDFYDFFFVDDENFCFVIGDVSGKGVPASLFMAITKTLHKVSASEGSTPDQIISRVNSELSVNNENSMFVTMFCGIMNTKTGEVLYTNAGHNPPVIVTKDGRVSFTKSTGDLVVGVFEDISYKMERVVMKTGDTFFLYTDGVTEAMNEMGEVFSEKRLEDVLSNKNGPSIKAIVEEVLGKIGEFSEGTVQSDDITMMALRYKGL
jgi:sigma-B regulation protein RsbU (phosphoserine phosphatase)